jgi:hypothetical protein
MATLEPKRRSPLFWAAFLFFFSLLLAACQAPSPISPTIPPENTAEIVPTSEQTQLPTTTATSPELTNPEDSPAPTEPLETPIPPANPPADTPTDSASLAPAQSATATRYVFPSATRRPSATPKISPTPTPPPAYLRIVRPGPYSKINSPLEVEAGVSPGDDGLVLVDLIGEDGRTITRQRLNYSEFIGRSIGIAHKMDFKIAGVAETTRLVISVDDKFGRIIALTSTELVLISIGDNQIYPASYQYAPYILHEPVEDQIITGGTLKVSGLARPVNLTPLIFELIDEKGTVIEAAQLQVPLPGGDQSHTPFEIYIPYHISNPTRVRLTIRQASDDRIPGTVALWSVPIFLQP